MKPRIRLTTLIGVFCGMLAVWLTVRSDNAGIVRKVHAKDGCSLDTLKGSYLVTGRADAPIGVLDPRFPRVHLAVWKGELLAMAVLCLAAWPRTGLAQAAAPMILSIEVANNR